MNRSKAREQAFILTFERAFHKEQSIEDMIAMVNTVIALDVPEAGDASDLIFQGVDPFAAALAKGVEEKQEELDVRINEFSTGWKIGRIPRVSLSVMRLAIYEMLFMEEIPVSVSINEAVELSKKYATKEDATFINGVLGSISKNIEAHV